MAYTITRLCTDCLDTACVKICPVECIYEYAGSSPSHFRNQLYIDPEECIDCGACEPECPWGAIFQEEAVPEIFADDIALNHAIRERRDEFKLATYRPMPQPTPDQVAENKRKWGADPSLTSARLAAKYKHEPRKRA